MNFLGQLISNLFSEAEVFEGSPADLRAMNISKADVLKDAEHGAHAKKLEQENKRDDGIPEGKRVY